MKKLKEISLFVLCLFCCHICLGQSIIPPAPGAQDLVNATSDISYYTGALNYSVPIFTITEGNITVPISLTYAGTGIKVNQPASWCGLGWTLNTGGVITRTVVGLPDETPNTGYNNYIAKGKLAIGMAPTGPTALILTKQSQVDSLANGLIDGEPDIFQFSIPGASGKLIRTGQDTFISMPYQQHVFPKYNPFLLQNNINIAAPTLLFTDDCLYDFSFVSSPTKTILRHTYFIHPSGNYVGEYYKDSTTYSTNAWYLGNITSLQGNMVYFTYDNYYDSVASPDYGETFYRPVTGNDNLFEAPSNLSTIQYTYDPHVKEIDCSSGKVLFISKQQSVSGHPTQNSFALDKILIEDTAQRIVKQFKFYYAYWSYIGATPGYQLIAYDSANSAGILMLTGIKELDSSGAPVNNGYRFEYKLNGDFLTAGGVGIASGYSAANSIPNFTDYWGYFNNVDHTARYDPQSGKTYKGLGVDLIYNPWYPDHAPWPNQNNPLTSLQQLMDLSCLEPNANAQVGSLTTIHTPTGLREDIAYSNNYGSYPSSLAPTLPSAGPGILVSGITITDSIAQRKEWTSFLYSYGFGASPPATRGTLTIYNHNISAYQQYETLNLGEDPTKDETIGYGQVTVEHVINYGGCCSSSYVSKEVYHFPTPSDQPGNYCYDNIPLVQNDIYSGYAFNAPHNERFKWLQGSLLGEEFYMADTSNYMNTILKKRTTSTYGYPMGFSHGGLFPENNYWGSSSIQLLPAVRMNPFAYIPNLSNRESYSLYYDYAGISSPVSSRDITYENGDSITVATTYDYTEYNSLVLSMIQKTFSDSTKTKEIFYYCDRFPSMANKTPLANLSPFTEGHYITSKIAEHITTRTINSNEYVISGEQFRYTGDGDVDSVYVLRGTPIPMGSFRDASDTVPAFFPNIDPHYVLAKKMRWNLRRSPGYYIAGPNYSASTGLDGLSESIDLLTGDTTAYISTLTRFQGSFLNGSAGSPEGYPSAIIKGASYAKAMSYLTPSGWTSDSAFNADMNHLRTSLPQASISTITYRPILGATTVTDPAGNTIQIDYDKDGRPIDKKDKNGYILESTEYHNK